MQRSRLNQHTMAISHSPITERTVCKHSLHLLCKDTMKPLSEPITGLTFTATQSQQSMPNCHIRNEFLAVTCDALPGCQTSHIVKLMNWKTRKLLLNVSFFYGICLICSVTHSLSAIARSQGREICRVQGHLIYSADLPRDVRVLSRAALVRIPRSSLDGYAT